jgi:NAD(P)H-dependent FMN reductase
MPNVPVILGTTRDGRLSASVAHATAQILRDRGATTSVIDLGDPPIPMFRERRSRLDPVDPHVEGLGRTLEDADAIIVVTPEYNWGIPGVLKNAADHFHPEFGGKPLGIIPVSSGPGGGRAALIQARTLFTVLGALVVPATCLVAHVQKLIDDAGHLTDEPTLRHLTKVVDDVLWWEDAARLKRAASP